MNSAQDVLNGGLLTPFTVARPSPPTTKEGAAAQREEKLKEQERAAAGRRMATQSLEETKRAQRRQLEDAEAYRTRQLMEIEGERPLPVSLPEFQSPRKTGEEMIGLLLVNAFATSALGKQNYLAAANAMTGAIRGYEAGKKTEYEQALKDFDVAVRKAVQEDKVNTAKYLQIANSKKMSVQDKFNLMRQEALRLDDKIMAAQLNTQQWDKVVAEVDRRLTAIDNTEREINREERRRVERAEERAERRAERAVDRAERGATGRTAQTWEVTDEQGKKRNISVMPQYDTQGRQTNEPAGGVLLGTGARAGTTTGGGAANNRYAFNINESFSQAAQDLLNVSQMPSNTVLGAFAGMTGRSGDSLATALRNNLARTVTPADTRMMQQIVAGLDQNMARALGGGYASSTSKGLIEAYKEQVAQYGDSPFAQAMFLSRMKQELGILAKAFKNHPGSNEGYVRDMKEYMDSLNEAIPFNVSDVISTVRGQRPTVTQKFSRVIQTPSRLSLPALGSPVTADERTGAEQAPATAAPSGPAASRAPEGVPQEVWNAMTPQERALWPR